MPLQLRRGTEAERQAMTQPLEEGEPLFITDENILYVGVRNLDGTLPLPKDLIAVINANENLEIISYNDLTDKPTLFTGDYNELFNKPTLFKDDLAPSLNGNLNINNHNIYNDNGPLLLGHGESYVRCTGLNYIELGINANTSDRSYSIFEQTTTIASQDITQNERFRGRVNLHELDLNGYNYVGENNFGYLTGQNIFGSVNNNSGSESTLDGINGLVVAADINNVITTEAISIFATSIIAGTGSIDTYTGLKVDTITSNANTKYVLTCDDPEGKLSIAGTITTGEITLPNHDGTNGQTIITDGNGILSWKTTEQFTSNIPLDSTGSLGDVEGMMAVDNSYLYRCIANYNGSPGIWVRIAWDSWNTELPA